MIVDQDQFPPEQDQLSCEGYSDPQISPFNRPATYPNSTFPSKNGQSKRKTDLK
jgi:hypothetical protein